MTVRPLLFDLSLIHAKSKITGRVSKLPIAESAFASIRAKPSCIKILGVYVVRGLHVAKTQPVAIKCGHLRMFVNVFQTNMNDICVLPGGANGFFIERSTPASEMFASLDDTESSLCSGRKKKRIMDTATENRPSTTDLLA